MEKKTGLYTAKVNYEEAKKLADYTSILQDLKSTREALNCLLHLIKINSKDNISMQCLWTSALVGYVRCFSHGKRLGLSEDIFKNKKLKGNPLSCHKYYKDQRDKHIAHSVNPFEQVMVGLVLSEPESQKRKILGIQVLSQKLIYTDIKGVKTFINLVKVVQREALKQAKYYEKKTLEIGKRLPIDSLYQKARPRIITPGPKDAGKAKE